MKKLLLTAIISVPLFCFAQDSTEMKIRSLEKIEAGYLSKGDLNNLYKIWDDHIVFSQNDQVIPVLQVKSALSIAKFPNEEILRTFSVTMVSNDIALVIGISRKGNNQQLNFTDIWYKKNTEWKLISRSNFLCE